MMLRLACIVIAFLLASAEISLATVFDWWVPELVLAGLLALCLAGEYTPTFLCLVSGGLVLDLTLGGVAGIHLLLYSLAVMAVLLLSVHVFHRPVPILAFFIFGLVASMVSLISALIYGSVNWQLVVPILLTTVLSLIFYRALCASKSKEVFNFG